MKSLVTSAPNLAPDRSAASGAAERVRLDILNGVLKPGERLRFEGLRAASGASMGALREAMTRLQAEGLVRGDAGRGFTVAPVSLRDLEDIEALRLDLELRALRSALQHGDDAWEAQLVSAYHLVARIEERAEQDRALLDDVWEARHRAFHFALLDACQSPWTLHFCGLLFDQGRRYRRLSTRFDPSPAMKRDEHHALLQAALERRADEACAHLAAHIRGTRLTLLTHLGAGLELEAT
jgi:GntR family transcriptional regulator, carbon starvation induced regulator